MDSDKAKTIFDKIRSDFAAKPRASFTALIYGDFGTGKTTILTTARRPIVIDFFDPKGWKLPAIEKGIEAGWILATDFSGDRIGSPTQYKAWQNRLQKWMREGFFENIGTYVIDSVTTWNRAMMNKIVNERGRKYDVPAQQDYLVQMNTIIDIIHALGAQSCDFIMTGHMEVEKDEDTGAFMTNLAVTKGLKRDLPLLFTEKWLLDTVRKGADVEYRVRTMNDGKYKASTRIGGGKFDMFEKPDIKYLLNKAGLDISDKPWKEESGE